MKLSKLLQVRCLIATVLLAANAVACAQEKAKRMIPRPSVKDLVPKSVNDREDCVYKIFFEQLLKPSGSEGGDVPLARPTDGPSKIKIGAARTNRDNECDVGQSRSKHVEMHFGFDTTDPTRTSKENSLVLAIRADGRAEAVLFDRDRSTVVAIYQSSLSKKSADQLATRVRTEIREANNRKIDETVIRESDLFYLSIKGVDGTTQMAAGKVEDMPQSVRVLVEDLNRLWKSWRETSRAAAYVRAEVIDKDVFESLRRKPDIKLAPVETFAPNMRRIIIQSINHLNDFHPLTRAQYEQLRIHKPLVIHNGFGYFLGLYLSEESSRPSTARGSRKI